jgi:uncharacterized membrane protein
MSWLKNARELAGYHQVTRGTIGKSLAWMWMWVVGLVVLLPFVNSTAGTTRDVLVGVMAACVGGLCATAMWGLSAIEQQMREEDEKRERAAQFERDKQWVFHDQFKDAQVENEWLVDVPEFSSIEEADAWAEQRRQG